MKEERVILSRDDADNLLAPGEYVHTFASAPGMMIGADMKREDILNSEHLELAGEAATAMHHGIAFSDGKRWLFAATR